MRIDASYPPVFDEIEATVFEELRRAKPEPLQAAQRQQQLIAWLQQELERTDDSIFKLPKACMYSIRLKWRRLRDVDPRMSQWYRRQQSSDVTNTSLV